MFLYENCLGYLYAEKEKLSIEQRHCSTCGHSDTYIGEANDFVEAWNLLKSQASVFASGGIHPPSLLSDLNAIFHITDTEIDIDEMSDTEALTMIEKVLGNPIHVFSISWHDTYGYDNEYNIIADNEEEALCSVSLTDEEHTSLKVQEIQWKSILF